MDGRLTHEQMDEVVDERWKDGQMSVGRELAEAGDPIVHEEPGEVV